jgi:hypothetical protein
MRFVSDPAIATKVARMKQRVRWQHPLITKYGIDQTHLEISALEISDSAATDEATPVDKSVADKSGADGESPADFSFLVIGDSGTSRHLRDQPQRRITERLLAHLPECQFILHTGDVVYLTGSSEQYPDNFIKPYREFIVGGENPHKIRFDQMTFNLPFLPTLGNHDYYDLSRLTGLLSRAFSPLRRLLRRRINLDVGWHGSFQGEGFTKAFLDYLQPLNNEQLEAHLQKHYTAQTKTGRCLKYIPGQFTRLPNRYYSFRQNGIDFFALDSNTFNAPQPLPRDAAGRAQRKKIVAQREQLEARVRSLLVETAELNMDIPDQADRATHIYAKIEQIEEQLSDIDKQLTVSQTGDTLDVEQLNWLRDRLIASWQDPLVKGRVLYFHHPPYVTEITKWFQGQTLAVRTHLRRVLDDVEAAIGQSSQPSARPSAARPLVDLVLSGHAHCFEYLQTQETGHGDRGMAWVVCGGSGFSLRRQREEGPVLQEYDQPVAKSHLFIGRSGHGSHTRRPYSALRVDIRFESGSEHSTKAPQFVLRPLIAERYQGEWQAYDLDKIVIESPLVTQNQG